MSSEADKRFIALYDTANKSAAQSAELQAKKKLFRQWLDSAVFGERLAGAVFGSEELSASFTYNTYSMDDYPNRDELHAYLHTKLFLCTKYEYKSKLYNTISELWEVMAPTVRVAELIVRNLA